MLWTDKYRPSFDVIPHDTGVLLDFIMNFKKQKKRSLLLHGPPGVGKTAAVYALADKFDLEVLEVNASDVRNADGINSTIGSALKQQSLFSKGKLILVDELDGISGMKDRGGTSALASLIAKSAFPIVLVANDAYHQKLKSLRSKSRLVEFSEVDISSMLPVLEGILSSEGLSAGEGVVKALARRSGGDLRGAIIDLQVLSAAGLSMPVLNSFSARQQTESIKQALFRIFKSTDPLVAKSALDSVGEDADQCILWIDENLPKEYLSPEELARAYESLSRADVFRGRIKKWQYWRFLAYVFTLISSGVAVAKDKKPESSVSYQRTQRILKLWLAKRKYAKRDAVASKLAQLSHCSKRKALEQLPYLQHMAKSKPGFAASFAEELNLDSEEVVWLSA